MAYKNIGNEKQITKNLTRLHRATYSWKINSQNDSSVRASGKTVVEKQNSTYERYEYDHNIRTQNSYQD